MGMKTREKFTKAVNRSRARRKALAYSSARNREWPVQDPLGLENAFVAGWQAALLDLREHR